MRPFVRIARGELRCTVYANLRDVSRGWNDGRRGEGGDGDRDGSEEGSNASEGEGLYRYVPAAVVCNIMITLPACAWLPSSLSLSPSHFLSLSVRLSRSPAVSLSLPFYAYTRLPGGHPLSAAMLPGNMIIVIICTLLRSYPPDSSPLRNSPVILRGVAASVLSFSLRPRCFPFSLSFTLPLHSSHLASPWSCHPA